MQIIRCVWEHNGSDTLLYSVDYPGAYTRGEDLETAIRKMPLELRSYCGWAGLNCPQEIRVEIAEEKACDLEVRDADSDVLFASEERPLSRQEYEALKELALKSASDFLRLYEAFPDKSRSIAPVRRSFYGQVPRTAQEMYIHTKNVNAYYFGEIEVDADNEGTILECRKRGFDALERFPDFLQRAVIEGSYGESWSLRKVLRRFVWHDRIHAKAMYRLGTTIWKNGEIPDLFCFKNI